MHFEMQNIIFTSKPLFHLPFSYAFVCLSLMLTNSWFSPEGRMGEEYTLHEESDDRLLDALAILELNCDLARTNISSAWATLKRFFPHFFPRTRNQRSSPSSPNVSWRRKILF
jgi:hypothetical protein